MADFGYKGKLNKLRKAIESDDFTLVQEEMMKEGEIGKLADAILNREREYQTALEKERKQKEYLRDLISDISHQLKTPIASLVLFTDILIREAEKERETDTENAPSLGEKRLELLRTQEQQLERMTWLTQSLLQLARLEADSVSFVKEPADLRLLCESVCESFQSMASEHNVTLLVTGAEAELCTDPGWMKEALGNVVKNAIEYSPEGKTVEIRIEHTPLVTRIFVKDEGEGIPEAERTKVFERFYRINGNTINPSSVGIGLALAKKITAGCGGRLYVNSRHRSECKGAEQPYTTMIFDFHNEVTSLEDGFKINGK